MGALSEKYLADCLENKVLKSSAAIWRNAYFSRGSNPFDPSSIREADILVTDGFEFHEFEIKISLKDFLRDALSLAVIKRPYEIDSINKIARKHGISLGKIEKFQQLFEGTGVVNYFTFVVPSLIINKLDPLVRDLILGQDAMIGVLLYEGRGVLNPKILPTALNKNTVEYRDRASLKNYLKFCMYLNRPTLNKLNQKNAKSVYKRRRRN